MTRAERRYPVGAAELDELLNAVGELVCASAVLREGASGAERARLAGIERVTCELQDIAMRLRLVPMVPLFDRIALAARGAALVKGRNLTAQSSGFESTHLDLAMVERAGAPLEQLAAVLADAVAGSTGEHLRLEARASGNMSTVRIELRFEGAAEVVISPELHSINVVRSALHSLQGELVFTHDAATRELVATATIPASLVTLEVLLVKSAEARYAIPLASIEETVSAPQPAEPTGRPRELELRGSRVPLFTLEGLLGKPSSQSASHSDIAFVMRTAAGTVFSLVVDEVLGTREVVLKALGEDLGDLPGVVGGAVLPDGSPTLVLDVQQVAETAL